MTSMMTGQQFKNFVKPFIEFRHLVIKDDKDAGTYEVFDVEECCLRAIQKDTNSWIVTSYETKTVKWRTKDVQPLQDS